MITISDNLCQYQHLLIIVFDLLKIDLTDDNLQILPIHLNPSVLSARLSNVTKNILSVTGDKFLPKCYELPAAGTPEGDDCVRIGVVKKSTQSKYMCL